MHCWSVLHKGQASTKPWSQFNWNTCFHIYFGYFFKHIKVAITILNSSNSEKMKEWKVSSILFKLHLGSSLRGYYKILQAHQSLCYVKLMRHLTYSLFYGRVQTLHSDTYNSLNQRHWPKGDIIHTISRCNVKHKRYWGELRRGGVCWVDFSVSVGIGVSGISAILLMTSF